MIEADKSYDGRTLTLHVGDRLSLSLAENPTTGFRWELKTKPEPEFETVTDTFESSGGSPGSGGTHHWQWKATRTGTAMIRLEYRRPWETNAPPGQVFSVTLQVE
jgi:inhibitor of cysteine peptidase